MNSKGIFNYMSSESRSSLYRNGRVYTRRDLEGSDSNWVGVNFQGYEILVEDGRSKNVATLEKHGFELIRHDLERLEIDFYNNDQVLEKYYPICENTVKDATGAQAVYAFDHNIRSAIGKKSKKTITGGQQVQGPAHAVHGDYTLTSAPVRINQLSKPPSKNDTFRSIIKQGGSLLSLEDTVKVQQGGRFSIINLWRSIVSEPVERNPLALCDASKVKPEDLVVFEIHYADRVGENYFAKYNPDHHWWFYPEMKRTEALLIKQWDSEGGLAKSKGQRSDSDSPDLPCSFSFHSAFNDPSTRDGAPDRWSIEVRCVALF